MSAARILIVDDEPGLLRALQGILTRDGHEVVAVDSGEAALAQIEVHEFDLALVDLKLKGIGGMEVLGALRQKWPDTVVIILTAHATLETAVSALRHGAHDYLFKPCRTVELRESVRTGLLRRRQDPGLPAGAAEHPAPAGPAEGPARFLQRGGVIVDVTRHLVTLDGQLLELSPTEFAILSYLAQESPRVVSSQELVREVQGYDSEAWEARDIVRFHVHRIRQKAHAATGHGGVIRTVRGVGYTLDT